MSTPAIAYTRVSSMQQADGCSLDDQERHCAAYAASHGMHIVATVTETYSGFASLDQRPGLQQARAMLRSGEAKALVFWRVDRMGREQTDNSPLHREVYAAGGELHSTTEGHIPNTALGKMVLNLYSYAAETEREAFVQRTRGALRTRAEGGALLAGATPLFGYDWSDARKSTYIIDAVTEPVVSRIFAMAKAGTATQAIARILNAEGVPTPKGATTWTRQTVLHILTNRAYAGEHIVYRWRVAKTEAGRRRVELRTEDDSQRLVHAIPATVSAEDFDQVQTLLARRALGPSTADQELTLLNRGFVYCAHCKQAARAKQGRKGERRYMCGHAANTEMDPAKVCASQWSVGAALVDAEVWEAVCNTAMDLDHVAAVLNARQARAEQKLDDVDAERQTIDAELADTEKQQATLRRRMATEDDDTIAAQYRLTLQELNTHHANLLKRQAALGKREAKAVSLLLHFQRTHELLARTIDLDDPTAGQRLLDQPHRFSLDVFTRAEKRGILLTLGAKVYIHRADDDYTRTHGRRWELVFSDSVGDSDDDRSLSLCVRSASKSPLMPAPGSPKIVSTPQSMRRSIMMSDAVLPIR